jgi:hypothetical protein
LIQWGRAKIKLKKSAALRRDQTLSMYSHDPVTARVKVSASKQPLYMRILAAASAIPPASSAVSLYSFFGGILFEQSACEDRSLLLRNLTRFSHHGHCVPCSFMNLLKLPDHVATGWLAFLKEECLKCSPATISSPPRIRLSQFLKILLQHEKLLPVKLHRYDLLANQSLELILQRQNGIALISDGKGHVVGLACEEKVLVDSDPGYEQTLDLLSAEAPKVLAKYLRVADDSRLNVMYLQLRRKMN